jgi:hypothetical protein
MTGGVTAEYLARCVRAGDGLRHAGRRTDFSAVLSEKVSGRVLARPIFIAESEIEQFAADAARIFDMIVSLPGRLFGGDTAAFCETLGIPLSWVPLLTGLGGEPPPLYGRADMYHDGTAFRLLEFNIESNLGGVDTAGEIPRALLRDAEFAEFAERQDLTYTHTAEVVAAVLRDAGAAVAGGRDPVIALIDDRGGLAADGADGYSLQKFMTSHGLRFLVGEIDQVQKHAGRLTLRGERVDVVLRDYSASHVAADPVSTRSAEMISRAHRDGEVVLWTPLGSTLYSNKACLALLSDPRWSHLFSADELAVVNRVIPWTRALDADTPDDLFAECARRRDEIILKPNALYGGTGIVAGWECDERDWHKALLRAMDRGYIAQQRVVPRAEPVVDPDTGAVTDWVATWGAFLTPRGYAGTFIRLLPTGAGSVISVGANPATHVAGLFAVRSR